jgi:hypothetical protein
MEIPVTPDAVIQSLEEEHYTPDLYPSNREG